VNIILFLIFCYYF